MARAGLKKVIKSVKGKKGAVKRSYWVKASAPQKKTAGGLAGKARKALSTLRTIGGNHYVQSALIGAGIGAAGRVGMVRAAGRDVARVGVRAVRGSFGQGGARVNAMIGDNVAHFGGGLLTQGLAVKRNKNTLATLGAYIGGSLAGQAITHHTIGRSQFQRGMDREARKRYGTAPPAQP